jgi:PAS domain S-box-containing protein
MEHSEKRLKAVPAGTRNDTNDRAVQGSQKKIFSLYAISFLFLAAVVVGFIWHDLGAEYLDTLAYWNVQLSGTADDRVRISGLWLNERRTDTLAVAESSGTLRLLTSGGKRSELAKVRQGVEHGMARIAADNGFLGGEVADRDCQIVAQTGLWPEMAQGVREACQAVQEAGGYRVDTFGMEQGHVWLSLSAPVMAEGPASSSAQITRRIVGSVVMVTENWRDIVPIFAAVSVPKMASETFVVWKKAGEAFIFSPLFKARGVESFFRRPLNRESFESRVAHAGDVAFGEFTNYRGQPVFGVARQMGMPGYSLARVVNRDEALSAYHRHRDLDWLVGALILLFLGSVMVAQHRHAAARDSAEKVRQQEALRDRDRRYRVLFESAGDGLFLMRGDQFVDCNQKALELFGCGREQLIGNTPYAFSPPQQPNGRDSQEAALEKIRLAREGQTLHFEWQHRRWDGTPVEAEVTLSRLEIAGEVHLLALVRDVTERKRTEQALKDSEERWRAVFENSAVGIALTDCISTQFQAVNLAFQKMVGYREDELRASTFMDITYEDDREPNRQLLSEVMEGRRQSFAMEKRYRRKDGSLIWVNLHVSLVPGTESIPRFSLAIVEDITERKQAETALQESDERLRSLFENATVGIYRTTPEGRILVANPALVEMLGYKSLEELVQLNLEEQGFESDHPRERFHERMARDGEVKGSEAVWKKQDGSVIFVRESARAMRGKDNRILYYDGFVEDITERKRAEMALRASDQRYKDFISHSHEGVWRVDLDEPIPINLPEEERLERLLRYGYIAECNLALARTFGFSSSEEMIGIRLRDLTSSSDQERLESFRSSVRGRFGSRTVELRGRDKAGNLKHLLRTEIPIVENGMLVNVWGITRDITELKQAEEELQRSFEQLRALAGRLQSIREEERKRVAREIHDQLGQALTAIKIDLSSLAHELPAGEGPQSNRASSLLKLVEESIRTVRRISTELRPGMLDDLGLVATIEWAGEDFQARTGTTCRMDLPQEDIAIDPERATAIFRIFQETLTNVARHADASEVKVRLAKEGGELTLEVHDNGKGISKDTLASGKSLGILGMRERAMLLGGELTIGGTPGNGTTVSVRIPEDRRT